MMCENARDTRLQARASTRSHKNIRIWGHLMMKASVGYSYETRKEKQIVQIN